jgi:hypothetical protein
MYRYTLRREWQPGLHVDPVRSSQHALFIMLNPSIADAFKDDPTVAKCMRLAMRWGFGALEVRNIFALRSTDPKGLRECDDPKGGLDNDIAIASAVNDMRTGLIVAAWGNHGTYRDRGAQVCALLKQSGRPVFAFKISAITKQPHHPLYQREAGVTPEKLVRFM